MGEAFETPELGTVVAVDDMDGMVYVRVAIWCVFCETKTPAAYIVRGSSVCEAHR